MKTLTRRQIAFFAKWTDAELQATWENLGRQRVKTGRNKGCVKLRAAKHADLILAEQIRRRRLAEGALA